jgi:uncharacterized protein
MSTKRNRNSLSSVLFGNTRQAVLGLLFGRSDESFYLREIARRLDIGLGAVQRELGQLTKAGIIRKSYRGNNVFFQAEKDSPIFAELKGLVIKTSGFAEILKNALREHSKSIEYTFIYGSIAKGEGNFASDIDLMVIGKVSFKDVVSALSQAQESLEREINPTVYSSKEFLQKVETGHNFIANVIKNDKIFIIGDQCEFERLVGKRVGYKPRGKSSRD